MKTVLLLLLALLTAVQSAAAETIKADEIVVTATKTETDIDTIPSNITVITQEMIAKSKAKTVLDLLRLEESIIVKDLFGNGAKSSVDMRGFDRGINTAVLIDGIKVNEIDLSGVDWNLIPIEEVDRIEIVRGSGSVLYGDNAMAGVINIITKKGYTPKPEVELGLRAESYNGHQEYLSARMASERVGFYGLLRNYWTSGYRENGEFHAQDAHGNVSLTITDSLLAEIRFGYHTDHQGYPGALFMSEIRDNRRQSTEPRNGADYEQSFYGAKLIFSRSWGDIEGGYHFNSRAFDAQDLGTYYDEWLSRWVAYQYLPSRDTDTHDFKLKVVIREPLAGFTNRFIAGLDFTIINVDALTRYSDDAYEPSKTATDLRKKETGFYVEDEFHINKQWIAIGGYRHTYAKFDNNTKSTYYSGKGDQSFSEDAWRAGITFNYIEGGKIFANYSLGFRLPTTDELFSYDGSVLHLKPETSNLYEIGIVYPVLEKASVHLTLYRMDVQNELFLNPDIAPPFGANDNIDKTRHDGIEAGFKATVVSGVSVFGNWTYSKVTFRSGENKGNTIPLRPRNTVSGGTDITLLDALVLGLQAHWVDSRYLENDVGNRLEKLPDYLTVDTRLAYKYKTLSVYAGVNNLFDEKYLVRGAVSPSSDSVIKYHPAPERNFYAGLTLRF